MLSPSKKVLFGAITTLLALALIEVAARGYSAIRFRNTVALWHGAGFALQLASGQADPPLTNVGRRQQERETDEIFRRRQDPELVPGKHVPGFQLNNGNPAFVNSQGLRGAEEGSQAAGHSTVRIGTFGGSYVFGAYLGDDETWPFLLGKGLRSRGIRAEVANAGVNGYNIHDILQSLIRRQHVMSFNYVVVTSAYNNHSLLPMERRYSWARRMDFYLYNASIFYVMAQEKLSLLIGQPLEFELYRQQIHVEPGNVAEWLAMYRLRLEQIAIVCRENGATLVLASQPEKFFDARLNRISTLDVTAVDAIGGKIGRGESVWRSELEFFLQGRLNIAVQEFANVTPGVLFFDGASVLAGDIDRYLLDPIHPGPLGAARLAHSLTEFFVRELQAHAKTRNPPPNAQATTPKASP